MSAIRLPLLCAFAGGCLSNLVLFGVWLAVEQPGPSHHRPEVVTAANAAPNVERATEPALANAAEPRHSSTEPTPTTTTQDPDNAAPMPQGSAVSDVLMRLEAAYRESVANSTPSQGSSGQERAAAPANDAVSAAEPAREGSAQAVAAVTPTILPTATAALQAPPVALTPPGPPMAPPSLASVAPAAVPAGIAPAAALPVAVVPTTATPSAVAPEFAAQSVAPPSEIHYGDVNQNTYITNVREGDVYLIQLQQLAMLQYRQLLGMSSGVAAAPVRHGGREPQRTAFPSGITNPDNPWGFRFAPLNLVR